MKTRQYVCDLGNCHKSFRNKQDLEKHIKFHENTKEDLKCPTCQKSFKTKQSLIEHKYTHSDKKKFRCPVHGCNKSFKQSTQLCNHKRVHREISSIIIKNDVYTSRLCETLANDLIKHDYSDLVKRSEGE